MWYSMRISINILLRMCFERNDHIYLAYRFLYYTLFSTKLLKDTSTHTELPATVRIHLAENVITCHNEEVHDHQNHWAHASHQWPADPHKQSSGIC